MNLEAPGNRAFHVTCIVQFVCCLQALRQMCCAISTHVGLRVFSMPLPTCRTAHALRTLQLFTPTCIAQAQRVHEWNAVSGISQPLVLLVQSPRTAARVKFHASSVCQGNKFVIAQSVLGCKIPSFACDPIFAAESSPWPTARIVASILTQPRALRLSLITVSYFRLYAVNQSNHEFAFPESAVRGPSHELSLRIRADTQFARQAPKRAHNRHEEQYYITLIKF